MTKPRDGYHTATLQFPLDVWAALGVLADQDGVSVNRLVAAAMAEKCGLKLPPLKRPGPKPKSAAAPIPDAPKNRGRKSQ